MHHLIPRWLLSLLLVAPALTSAADRPNIVLLFADDLGYGETGCQGNPQIPTPNIDSIAKNGVRFTNGYVTAAYCSASRAGLLTGKFGTRFGYEFNPTGHHNADPGIGLPRNETTIAELLQDAGYATGLVGKWHLGGSATANPLRHGFDEFFGFTHEGHYFVPPPYKGVTTMLRRRTLPDGTRSGRWQSQDDQLVLTAHMGHNEPAYDADNPIVRSGQPINEHDYLTDAFTREAVDFIDRHKRRPFFLYMAYNAVHSPLQARDEDMQRFAHIKDVHRRIFAGMLSRLDHSVGEILKKLGDEKLAQRTIVFFISDNGGPTRELTSSNAPLRGGKGMMYEGGIRVPFLMQWPQTVTAGSTYEKPVCSVDVLGTAAAVSGAKLPRGIDGVNLLPFVTGSDDGHPHPVLYWRQGNRTALRNGDWKLVRQPAQGKRPKWELYNLSDDWVEQNDLAQQQPEKLQALVAKWEQLNAEMAEPMWKPGK